jgi:RHS repeat-associated protein
VQAAKHKTLFLAAMLILGVQPLAAHTHVVQNSRLGLDTFKTSLHQEIELRSSLKALEIDASVRQTCVRSRSTGKERDAETGLDYFGARYLSSAQGRFTSPDLPLYAQRPGDPQSWNLYSYTRNNPLRYIDPDGRQDMPPQAECNGNQECIDSVNKANAQFITEGCGTAGVRDSLICLGRKNFEKSFPTKQLPQSMPRSARLVLPGSPRHATQRGTDRQILFHTQRDQIRRACLPRFTY